MTTPKNPGETLFRLLDAVAEHVSEISDGEILDDSVASGRTETARSRVRELLLTAVTAAQTHRNGAPADQGEKIAPPASLAALMKRLKTVGLERDFVVNKLLTPELAMRARTSKRKPADEATVVAHLVQVVSRMFNWTAETLFGDDELPSIASGAAVARFKLPANAESQRTVALAAYARYLGTLVLQATPNLVPQMIPVDARQFRRAVLAAHGELTLRSTLAYAWTLGIPVLPLADSGGFHGATWRLNGRNVVALKQKTPSEARWLHDFLHELRHAGENPSAKEFDAVDLDQMPQERRESTEEQVATAFAADAMLDGRAEDLAKACVREANGIVPLLKEVVPRVAARAGVTVDALANYMAFRLSLQGVNWWGAASNLQTTSDPWSVARDFLFERLDLHRLDEQDRAILLRALGKE